MKRTFSVLLISLGILTAVIGTLYLTPLSYLYCLAREGAWSRAKSRIELENQLPVFRSTAVIAPAASGWGRNHVLEKGQVMIRYLIFGKEPLDVVYQEDGSVIAFFTSYE